MKQKQPDITLSPPSGYKESVAKDLLREIHNTNNHDAVRILSSRDVIELLNGAIERKRQEAPEGQSRELLESISTALNRSHEIIKSHASLPRIPDDASLNLHTELDIMDQHLALLAQDNQAGQIQLLSTLVNLAEKQLGNIELPNDERKAVKTNLGLPSLESISEVSINTMQWVMRFRLVTSEMLQKKQKQLEKNPTDENLQKDIKRLQNTLARAESILTAANEYQKKFLPILKPIENLTAKKASAETMLPMRTLAAKIISYEMNPNKQRSDYEKLMQAIEQEKKSLQKKANSFFTSKEEKKHIESFIAGLDQVQIQIKNEAQKTFAATELPETRNTGQNPLASKQPSSKSNFPNPLKSISKAVEPLTTRASAGVAALSSTAQMLEGVLAKVAPMDSVNNAKNTIVAAGKTLAILVEGVDTVTLAQTAKVARDHVASTMDKTKRIKETKLTDKAESMPAEAMRSSTTDAAQRVSGSGISGIISDAAKTVTSVASTVTSSVSDLKSAAASRFTKSATTPTVRPDPAQVLENFKITRDAFRQAQLSFVAEPMVADTSASPDRLKDMVAAKNKYFEAAAQLPEAIKAAKGQLKSDLTKEYVDFKRDKDSTELYVKGFEAQAAKARPAPAA